MAAEYPTTVRLDSETTADIARPVLLGTYAALWLACTLGGALVAVTLAEAVGGAVGAGLLVTVGLGAVAAGPVVARRAMVAILARVA